MDRDLYPVLAAFFGRQRAVDQIEPLGGAGGFSGAALWRLSLAESQFCLRRWPAEHPDRARLQWIHRVLTHVANAGLTSIPRFRQTIGGGTILAHRGCLWELSSWMPGSADYHRNPSLSRLRAAMAALANFHQLAATCPGQQPQAGHSPGISDRLRFLRRLAAGELDRIEAKARGRPADEFSPRAVRLVQLFRLNAGAVEALLTDAAGLVVPLQVCIRDIWHDHVLFQRDQVTGLVDFGAMRVESVAGDVARLVGSFVADDQSQWAAALEHYGSLCPLVAEEQQLIRAFDRSSALLSGMNWLRWIYVEGRVFEDPRRVLSRLDQITQRLEHLTGRVVV